MKEIKKLVLRSFFYCIYFIGMDFIISVLPDMMAGYYTINIRDMWYIFKEQHMQYYVAFSIAYVLIISEIWNVFLSKINSRWTLLFYLALGNLLLIFAGWWYWWGINKMCFTNDDNDLYLSCSKVFESINEARKYYSIYNVELYSLSSICVGIKFWIKETVWKASTKDILLDWYKGGLYILKEGITIFIIMLGNSFILVDLEIPLKGILIILEYIIIPVYTIWKIVLIIKRHNEYEKILSLDSKKIVILKKNNGIIKDVGYIRKTLKEKNIYLVSDILGKAYSKNGVALIIFDGREMLIEEKENSFTIIYDILGILNREKNYEEIISVSKEDVVKKIEWCCEYVDYRNISRNIIDRICFKRNKYTNCVIEEIVAFQKYIYNETDLFLIFDYAVKWFEILNYFYALILISENQIPIENKEIRLCDFDKWLEFRKKHRDQMLKQEYSHHKIFNILNSVCKKIMKREYEFKKYTQEEIFELLILVRNYTRGHGVYTFKITQRLNLQMILILVFLINRLLKSGKLDRTFENLENLGWIVYIGSVPYFLYSFEDSEQEYVFNSYQKGNSVMLPIDYMGEGFEVNEKLE